MKKAFCVILVSLFLISAAACGRSGYITPAEDEIVVSVQLHTEAPVYELVCLYGTEGDNFGLQGGGNADGTAATGSLDFRFDHTELEKADGIDEFLMEIGVRTTRIERNGQYDWSDLYGSTTPASPVLHIPMAYGHVYLVELTGDAEQGFTVTFLGEQPEPNK